MSKSFNIDLNEPCHFCGEGGEYWDFVNGKMITICRKHIKIEASS